MQPTKFDQSKSVISTTSKLEIKSVTSDMAGKYSCEVSNLGGTDQSGKGCLTVSKSKLCNGLP